MLIPDSLKRSYISSYIKRKFADIIDGDLDFDLDTKNKSASLSVKLIGEDSSIKLKVLKYEIISDPSVYEGSYFIKISDISCSKKWLEDLLKRFVKDKNIPIPEEYAVYL